MLETRTKRLCNIVKHFVLISLIILSPTVFASAKLEPVVNLNLWSHHRHMADATKKLIAEFNNTVGRNQRIKVNLRILGDDSLDVFQDVQQKGCGPDLFSTVYITGYSDPFKEEVITWFDDLPGFEEWKQQWPSWYWIEGVTTYRGHVYAIPSMVYNSRLIYNRDLFRAIGRDPDSPPRSYAEVKEIAKQITDLGRGRYFGFAYCGGESWPVEWMPSQWAEANGDPAYWDWKRGRWAMAGYKRLFQLMLDLKKEGSLFPGVELLSNDALRAHFAEGKIGMFMGEFWDVGVLKYQFPSKCDWGIASIPTYDGKFHGKPRAMMLGGLWYLNGKSRYKIQAWEVIKWFSRYDIRAKLYEESMCIDPDLEVMKYVKKRPVVKGFADFAETLNQDYFATYPNLPGWTVPPENPCTVFRKVLAENLDITRELKRLEANWNQQLDQFYRENPHIKRGWNTYPEFDRKSGHLGLPLVKPVFKD